MMSNFNGPLGIIWLVIAILVIYDVWVNQKKMAQLNKILWTVAALVFSLITAIVYWLLVKRK